MSDFVWGQELQEIEEILGIEQLQDVTIKMPINGVVTAEVEFILNSEQVDAVLALLRDGTWKRVDA